ncbi:DUF748 domain-containing protein [Achromobacter sp. SD115]|uniref:DUF748 domain-containing protein n=1 Tax=Achromobacter sp. SD115 TaxID=2782011 RepID=UPI001A9645AE|nr:DUF748 domain-containing protein [Achromobacter sp. SD115]MBO1012575.1 DUF748 domain-containing protein [Achromobacter sp. SD115]
MNLDPAAPRRKSPWGNAFAVLTLIAAVAVVLAFAALRIAEQRIANMLGPRGQVGHVEVGYRQVILKDVTISGGTGQAGATARQVVLEPEWPAFLRHEAVFKTVTIEGFDFTVVRRANGDMDIAPALQSSLRAGEGGDSQPRARTPIRIAELILRDGRLDFEDAAVSRPAHRIPFSDVQARLRPLTIPGDGARSDMEFTGNIEGNRNGAATVRAEGWLVVGGTDADIKVAVRNMDIKHAAPYLADNGATSLAAGTMDLDMRTAIAKRQLQATGTVALRGLRFSGDGSLFSLPRKAVLAALKDQSGTLRFDFALAGDLDNPKFSATRGFTAQVARGFGHAIGVGAEGAAEGVTGAVKELGNALSDLLTPKP